MRYVIGVDGGSTKCLMKAADLNGRVLAQRVDKTTNHLTIGATQAAKRIAKQINALLAAFEGKKEDCALIVVGAAGIDSPHEKSVVENLYHALLFGCPIFCMNDAAIALYATTKGLGVLTISGTGSIVIGRNQAGKVTRSGGYPVTIFGDEGSGNWIGLMALRHASRWIDESVPRGPLIDLLDTYYRRLDANKLITAAISLRRRNLDGKLAPMVYEAAKAGDPAALAILEDGATQLFRVTQTCVKKLAFDNGQPFLAGVWGSVFVKNEFFRAHYQYLFAESYPGAQVVLPQGDAADGALALARDYLAGKIDFIEDL